MDDPLLIDVPARVETARLILRSASDSDGPVLHASVTESLERLRPWMPWAQAAPSRAESDATVRRMLAQFALRQDLPFLMFERTAEGGEGRHVGGTGLHRIDWALRRFEIGYWVRSGLEGRGLVTEAARAMSRLAFDALRAERVEIRMDALNRRSRHVAERAGFTFEGTLRRDSRTPAGAPRDTCVYARVRGVEEPVSADA